MPTDTNKDQATEENQTKADSGLLHVKVYSPFNVYFDDDADSLSAENDTGPFDVLIGHKNFLTLLLPCDIIIRSSGNEDQHIKITRGMMHVRANKVVVYLDV